MDEDKVIAVIVTNNRLPLLVQAVEAVRAQSYPLLQLIVVNNGSTDGTAHWLDQQEGIMVVHQENCGGSGGFHTGIRLAATLGADWIWVMDDDTICQKNALEKLVEKVMVLGDPVGFIGSKCVWEDNSPHLMNIPAIKPTFNGKLAFNSYDSSKLMLIETCSFVSLLINQKAVEAVGLPYKEFFIWGDDQEYTRRITKTGMLGFYCMDSIVLHKTPKNYFPDFYNDTPMNLWKHEYGFRNEFFMVKKNKGTGYFLLWLVAKVGYTSIKLWKKRDNHRIEFLSALFNAARKSIFFNPKISRL